MSATNTPPVDRAALVKRLETLCTASCNGDTEAIAKVKQIKEAALAGDPRAKLALAGLRHLYWRKQEDTVAWDTAEAIYRQTAKGDAKATVVVKGIIAQAKAGDPVARGAWARMKAIHGSTKPGALFPSGPGQARMGGYGMPVRNRAGIVVGGASGPNLVGGPDLIGATRPHVARMDRGRVVTGGYGSSSYGDGLGVHARNYADRLVGGYGSSSYGDGLGVHARNYADRLVGGPTLIGGRGRDRDRTRGHHILGDDRERSSMRDTMSGTELMGGLGLPVRNRAGLVVGRSHVAFGGALTAPQIAELRDLMQRARSAHVTVLTLGRQAAKLPPSQIQAIQSSQKLMAQNVASARARGSVAYPSLVDQLWKLRAANIAKGIYLTDDDFASTDAYQWHVPLTDAGAAVVAANPVLQQVGAAIPDPDPSDPARLSRRRRGFTIAMGVRNGQVEAGFPAWFIQSIKESEARAGVPLDTFYGFTLGMGSNDGLFHSMLQAEGQAALARDPSLAQKMARLPTPFSSSDASDQRRGFTIGAGVRSLNAVPQYAMFVRQALLSSPATVAGFDAAMSS